MTQVVTNVKRIHADASTNLHEIRRAIQRLNKQIVYLTDLLDNQTAVFLSNNDSEFDLDVSYKPGRTRVVVNNLDFYRKDDDTESLGIWDYEEIENTDGTYTKIQTRNPVPYGTGVVVFYIPER